VVIHSGNLNSGGWSIVDLWPVHVLQETHQNGPRWTPNTRPDPGEAAPTESQLGNGSSFKTQNRVSGPPPPLFPAIDTLTHCLPGGGYGYTA
jgi:hypothetical protein